MTEVYGNDIDKTTADQLKSFIGRIERLGEEKQAIADDIKEVFAEAKAMGFDVRAMREAIRLRKCEPHKLEEFEAVLWTYRRALGDLDGTPLGEYAARDEAA